MSASLEDYLETIFELVRDQKVARVRDIARARGVRAASVTPAMRKLLSLGLIRYEKREYIDLTPAGQREAQRVFSRHQVLKRFFLELLAMPEVRAEADACAMEHNLSPEGMDHLVRLFEFLTSSPDGRRFLGLFHRAPPGDEAAGPGRAGEPSVCLTEAAAGARVRVVRILGSGPVRDRLLDLGLLPDVVLEVAKIVPGQGGVARVELRLQGFGVRLSGEEARAVRVAAQEAPP